jgi:endonuclease/exonuclease/phosphatase family metal-dependent hydrolase
MKPWLIVLIVVTVIIAGMVIGWFVLQKYTVKNHVPPPSFAPILKPIKPYAVMTYNIQKFPFSMKSFDPVIDLFREHHIILLQECFDDVLDPLVKIFPEYHIFRGTLQGINLMNSGLALLSKFPIVEGEFVQFNNFNSLTFDVLSEKGFISVVLDINGEHVRVVNTHLQSCDFDRYDPASMLQLDELLRHLSIRLREKYYFVGGDFNIDVTDLLEYYHHFPQLLHPNESTIFINFTTSHTRCTKKLGYDGLTFDYFFASKSVKMSPPRVVPCDYSDHNPVSATIELIS